MTTHELLEKDIETNFGAYDGAISTGFDFWTSWDEDADSDRSLATEPRVALEKTLVTELTGVESPEEVARVIARATRLLTLRLSGYVYSNALNEMYFNQMTGESPSWVVEGVEASDLDVLRAFSELTKK